MINGKPYNQVLKKWILSIAKQRTLLVNKNKSHINKMRAVEYSEYIKRHLNAYPYNDDVNIARFFVKNSDKIKEIITGPGSTSHTKKMQEFESFKNINQLILQS